jgi:hypothetical protein
LGKKLRILGNSQIQVGLSPGIALSLAGRYDRSLPDWSSRTWTPKRIDHRFYQTCLSDPVGSRNDDYIREVANLKAPDRHRIPYRYLGKLHLFFHLSGMSPAYAGSSGRGKRASHSAG